MSYDKMLIGTKTFKIAANCFGNQGAKSLAILLPGRLDTKDYINFTSHGQHLASLGYFVIAIDPPFTWDSPGDIQGYSTTTYVQAVNELIEHFGNKPTTLLGHSRGGATAMLVSKNPTVDKIVLVNAAYGSPTPPSSSKVVDGFLPESRDMPPGDMRTDEKRKFLLPLNYFKDGESHDPVVALKSFKGQKILIHATHDEFCDLEEVMDIFKELDEPKFFLEIDRSHDYRLFPEAIESVNKVLSNLVD